MDSQKSMLIVCNFTQPWYGNIAFLERIYLGKRIEFYGDEKWDAPDRVIKYNQSNGTGSKASYGAGFFAYRSLMDAVQRFPDFDGYLFMMDDVLLRTKVLNGIDPSVIYTGFDKIKLARLKSDGTVLGDSDSWGWWNISYAGTNTAQALSTLVKDIGSRASTLPNQNPVFVGAASDLMYLPKARVSEFLGIFESMSNAQVFTEIAFPTGINMM